MQKFSEYFKSKKSKIRNFRLHNQLRNIVHLDTLRSCSEFVGRFLHCRDQN